MFGRRCKGVHWGRADDSGGPRIRALSKELSHFEKVSGWCAWFIAMVENAEVTRDVSLVRLFHGFDENVLMPLCIRGGVNVDVPTLGEVL